MPTLEVQYDGQSFVIRASNTEVWAVFTDLNHKMVMSSICAVDKQSNLRKEWKFRNAIKENTSIEIRLSNSMLDETPCSEQTSLKEEGKPKTKLERFNELEQILTDKGLL